MGIMKTLTINGVKYDVVSVVPASSVTLLASAWVTNGEKHSQVVEIPGVTANTQVDLQPTAEQLVEFHYKVLAFVAENDGGVVTVYAIGDKPESDHTIQITQTEVEGAGKIRGNTVGTSVPRPDWNQTDPNEADYIRNKPAISGYMGAEGTLLTVDDSGDAPLHSLKLYGKTTQNGTPSPSSPVPLVSAGDRGTIKTTVCGGNLLPYPYKSTSATSGGLTYTVQSDGGIKVSGTKTATTYFNLLGAIGDDYQTEKIRFTKPVYVLIENGFSISARLTDGTYTEISGDKALNKPIGALYVNCSAAVNTAIDTVIYPMISYVNVTEYEPYKGGTLTATTPHGLPGIPVASGGNYTDENGQQWVCDEIDFSRGVYVKRIGVADYGGNYTELPYRMNTNTSGKYRFVVARGSVKAETAAHKIPQFCTVASAGTANTTYVCSDSICYNNSYGQILLYLEELSACTAEEALAWLQEKQVKIQYILESPVETALSAEELSAFAALHTNKPNTTVYNDAGAYMEVGYYTPMSALPVAGGSMGGNLRMAGNKVTDLGTPTLDTDATNKAYVDSASRIVNGVEEWVNPPLVAGVAYRTTERYNGYPVWVKRIFVGDATANTAKSVAFLNENEYPINFALAIRACAYGTSFLTETIPNTVAYSNDGMFEYYVEVTPASDMTDIYATVWYIRED